MKIQHLIPIVFLAAFCTISAQTNTGFSQQISTNVPTLKPAGTTNTFYIDLQDGYDGSNEVMVAIDDREVYRGKPKTPVLAGCANQIVVRVSSPNPVVSLEMPASKVKWSKKFDLTAGRNIGLSVETNGVVDMQQKRGFAYD